MIKVLGAAGSYSHQDKASSFLIENDIVIDAGNIIESMGEKCCDLEHIFITHTHLDHIKDLPFVLEGYFETRKKTLNVYALRENIQTLQKYIFNESIWPNFENIMQNGNKNQPSLELIPIEYEESLYIDDIEITPIPSNHTTPTCGFKIKKNDQSCLISGDTYLNSNLIEYINLDTSITSLIVEVSFSSKEDKLALKSKHLTPKLLQEMLLSLKRDDVAIYTYHHKPMHVKDIDKELADMNLLKNGGKRLETGDILNPFTPSKNRKTNSI